MIVPSETAAAPQVLTPQQLTTDEIRAALNRPTLRIPTTAGYQIRLVTAVLGMVLLQALYCMLVVGVAWLIVYLLLLPPSSYLPNLLLFRYGVPIGASIAGAFLLKPLFIRPPRPPEAVELTREQEPILFAFVDQLCELVGSRRPSRIRVDLQVNACARMPGWRGLLFGDVELIIGLPIVAGLTLHQLAGVLAHEFGHFSQRAGMRSSYLIQHIENWFGRVVYQRDFMDQWLDRRRSNGNLYIRSVLWIAHGTVWVSRQYLTLLMQAARHFSSRFSHQMEFDADRYEAAITGAKIFEETAAQFALLGVGAKLAWTSAERDWPMHRLPADMVSLVAAHTRQMSDGAKRSVIAAHQNVPPGAKSNSAEYNSHPSMQRRIEMVRAVPAITGMELTGPAARAFRNFARLCRTTTQHHYQTMMGLILQEVDFVESQTVLTALATAHANYAAATDLFQLRPEFVIQWLRLPGANNTSAPPLNAQQTNAEQQWSALLHKHLNHHSALCIRRAGIPVKPASFQLESAQLDSIQIEESQSMTDLRFAMLAAQASRRNVAEQIEATLFRVLASVTTGEKILLPDHAHPLPIETALNAWECYVALSSFQTHFLDLRRYCAAAWNIRVNQRFFSKSAYELALRQLEKQAQAKVTEILAATRHVPNIMCGPSGMRPTLASQLSVTATADPQADAFHSIRAFLDRADLLAVRCLGELAWMTQTVTACPAGEAGAQQNVRGVSELVPVL